MDKKKQQSFLIVNESYTIDLLIAMKAHPHICGKRKCDLCLCEKVLIGRAN